MTDFRVVQNQNYLYEDKRLLDLLKSWHSVALPDYDYNDKLVWCLESCNSKFRDILKGDVRYWYFQNEHDATIFAIKWS